MGENLSNVISINNKPRTEVDIYLDSLGLWRKPIPKDGSCFYRAVSEQLFSTQAFYGHLQKAVEEKMASRTCSFCSDSSNDTSVDLTFSLEDSEVCGSYMEIKLLSDIYRLNFFIYTGIDSIYSISKTGHEKQILLFFDGIHYDSVYPKSFPPEAALCQSVVYDILYRNVFEMPKEIEEAVNILRKQNKCKRVRNNKNPTNDKKNGVGLDSIASRKDCENRKPSPPLPYRVAKALDPDIFRNVEFDNWQEAKRAELLAKKLSEFQPGDKCQVILEGSDRTYHAHVQEIPENGGPVEVFVEELGKKCQVAYDCLRHLPLSGNSERYQTKSGRKCRKAVTMVVHMNGTSQLVSSNLTTSTKSKKNVANRQQSKMFIQSKFNSSSTRSIKLTRAFKFQKNLNMVGSEDELNEQLNDRTPAVSLNDNSVCECQYCKQLLFEQDLSNSEGFVTSPGQQIPTHEESNDNTFISANIQPSLTNANNNINDIVNNDNIDNNLQFQTQPLTVTSQITINPHIWIPYLERVNNSVNINAGVSQDPCGRDMPLSDMPTLRFFYNLGCEYYRAVSLLQTPPTNSLNNNSSQVRYNSTAAPAVAAPVYYPTHHTYTQQLYAMYPQNFSNIGMSSGQSPHAQYIPCVAYMQNVQYTGNAVPPQWSWYVLLSKQKKKKKRSSMLIQSSSSLF